MSSPNEIKKGIVIKQNGNLAVVVDFQRVSPGKGGSFVRTRLKDLKTGKVKEVTFKAAETLEFEDVQYKKMAYLFNDATNYTFMDGVSYEQVTLAANEIGDDAEYLKEGLEVTILMYNGGAIGMQLPQKITYQVTEADPAVKGDTASGNVTKAATMDNGLIIKVPIFVKPGDTIVVNPETKSYVERSN